MRGTITVNTPNTGTVLIIKVSGNSYAAIEVQESMMPNYIMDPINERMQQK